MTGATRAVELHGVGMTSGLSRRPACACSRGAECPSPGKHPKNRWAVGNQVLGSILGLPDNAETLRHSNGNVGTLTGQGLLVLDVDLAGSKTGGETWARLVEHVGEGDWSNSADNVVCTGSGGLHVYLRYNPQVWKVTNASARLRDQFGPHLDVRGDGGLVVAPPSLHVSGGRYYWTGTRRPVTVSDLPAAPTRLLDILTGTREPAAPPSPPGADGWVDLGFTGDTGPEDAPFATVAVAPPTAGNVRDPEAYVRASLLGIYRRLAETTSGRNDAFNRAAFDVGRLLARFGERLVDEHRARTVLTELVCSLPGDHEFTRAEARTTWRSGFQAGLRKGVQ